VLPSQPLTEDRAIDFCVVYYPRSGGKYFVQNYEHMTGLKGDHVHDIKHLFKNNVISIIRKPTEAIASTLVAGFIIHNIPGFTKEGLPHSISQMVQEYIDTYLAILESDSIVVEFEDVVNNFIKVSKKVSDELGHKIVNEFINKVPETSPSYLSSSVHDDRYAMIYSLVSNHEKLAQCEDLYLKALSLCKLS